MMTLIYTWAVPIKEISLQFNKKKLEQTDEILDI